MTVVTRRALFGAGAVALLAGCGPAEEPEVDAGDVLSAQLRVTGDAAAAYENLPGVGDLRANAERRVRRIEDALTRLGKGEPSAKPIRASSGLEHALAAENAALRAHVAAVGQLQDRDSRELLAGLIADSAAAESALLARLGRPPVPTAFPGGPV